MSNGLVPDKTEVQRMRTGKNVINGWLLFCFCLFFVQHPGQQFFSHVGMEPPLPGYLPVLLGSLGVLLKEQ